MSIDLSVIVFSKDRPLQLHGYLESLLTFSNIEASQITVLYKDNPLFSYKLCRDYFPGCNWVLEENFADDFSKILGEIKSKYVMFGCDDVVFTRHFSFDRALQNLEQDKKLFTFSLRMGKNIYPHPREVIASQSFLKWSWVKGYWTHWAFPWELDASVYRVSDVKDIVSSYKKPVLNPNFLEANFYEDEVLYAKYKNSMPLMMSFDEAKLFVITVNRVQDTHLNSIYEGLDTDVGSLDKKYQQGFRLDYRSLRTKIMPKKIHVDGKYLLLVQANSLSVKFSKFIKLLDLFNQFIYFTKYYIMNPLRFMLRIKT